MTTAPEYKLKLVGDGSITESAIWSGYLSKDGKQFTGEPYDSSGEEICDSPVLDEISFSLTEEHLNGTIEHLDYSGLDDPLGAFANEALGYYQELAAKGELVFEGE